MRGPLWRLAGGVCPSTCRQTLPPEFAQDADRRLRFEREAKTLASLNHPHIAQVYGLEDIPGTNGAPPSLALVMELVEGEDLAARISRGVVPLDEVWPLARQIAEGLEAAHEAGIVHRELKPANIRVTPDGVVKVLDFGLAKPIEPVGVSAMATRAPTLTTPAHLRQGYGAAGTEAGVVLGTASYMASEQAKGKPVDRRADIWAFGCVLYELLTGKRAFAGEDVPDILGAIIKSEPDWARLPAATPARIRTLLQRCLAKDRTQRLQHIGDARLELVDVAAGRERGEAKSSPTPPARLPWALAAVAGLIAVSAEAALFWRSGQPPVTAPVVRFSIPLPADQQFTSLGRHVVKLSPDGSTLVYVADQRLYQRRLDGVESAVIPGTESKTGVNEPVFSPDGQSIAYYSNDDRAIRRTRPAGSGSQTVCSATSVFGMSWAPEGIFFGQARTGIMRVDASGGTPEAVVPIQEPAEAAAPHLLPGGEWLVFTLTDGVGSGRWDEARIVAQSLKTGERKVLVPGASDSTFVTSNHLLYRSRRTLFAVGFDPVSVQTIGTPETLADEVRVPFAPDANPPTAQYAASNSGVLAYVKGPDVDSAQRQLAIIDERGVTTPLGLPPANYVSPRVSPDGRLIAVATESPRETAIWIYEIEGNAAPRRLTFDGQSQAPAWSADGTWVYFLSTPERDTPGLYRQRADGSGQPERLTRDGRRSFPESAAPDGSLMIFTAMSPFRLMALTLATKEARPVGDMRSATPFQSALSPDGKWLAYQVSNTNAGHPVWMHGGKALMIEDFDRSSIIDVETSPPFRFGASRDFPRGNMVTTIANSRRNHDAMPDGRA